MEKTVPASPHGHEPVEFALTPDRERELASIMSRYPNKQAACIPVLHLCQEQNGWVSEGVIKFKEDVVEGLENAPGAFIGMLEGKNFGKLVVKVAES